MVLYHTSQVNTLFTKIDNIMRYFSLFIALLLLQSAHSQTLSDSIVYNKAINIVAKDLGLKEKDFVANKVLSNLDDLHFYTIGDDDIVRDLREYFQQYALTPREKPNPLRRGFQGKQLRNKYIFYISEIFKGLFTIDIHYVCQNIIRNKDDNLGWLRPAIATGSEYCYLFIISNDGIILSFYRAKGNDNHDDDIPIMTQASFSHKSLKRQQ